jgi:serine protease Do
MTRHLSSDKRILLLLGLAITAAEAAAQPRVDPETLSGYQIMMASQEVFRSVVQEVLPTVVEINTYESAQRNQAESRSLLEFFFGNPNSGRREPEGSEQERMRGLGSGVVVRRENNRYYVLTNNHVITDADRITITLHDGRTFESDIVGTDQSRDLALLRFEGAADIEVARLGDSESVEVGDWVLAVGNPLGFSSTVTSGIVSAIGRRVDQASTVLGSAPLITDYIQTDAAINHGNSGGALVNLSGDVVGINTWIASQPSYSGRGGSIGLGFAIPVNVAKRIIEDLIADGRVRFAWLGILYGQVPRAYYGDIDSLRSGALVHSVHEGSPAERAGIQPGDVITAVDGGELAAHTDILRVVANIEPGSLARFEIYREGEARMVSLRPVDREERGSAASSSNLWPGMRVIRLDDGVRARLGIAPNAGEVIVAQIEPGSPAAQNGFRTGDIIREINSRRVSDLESYYRYLNADRRGAVSFRVLREGTELGLELRPR